jgi:hypothetical protein
MFCSSCRDARIGNNTKHNSAFHGLAGAALACMRSDFVVLIPCMQTGRHHACMWDTVGISLNVLYLHGLIYLDSKNFMKKFL